MESPIREHRKQLGVAASELAAALGVSISTLGFWERGHVVPPEDRQRELAGLLGVPEDDLRSELVTFRDGFARRAREKLARVS